MTATAGYRNDVDVDSYRSLPELTGQQKFKLDVTSESWQISSGQPSRRPLKHRITPPSRTARTRSRRFTRYGCLAHPTTRKRTVCEHTNKTGRGPRELPPGSGSHSCRFEECVVELLEPQNRVDRQTIINDVASAGEWGFPGNAQLHIVVRLVLEAERAGDDVVAHDRRRAKVE